jgi:hypothetical protein
VTGQHPTSRKREGASRGTIGTDTPSLLVRSEVAQRQLEAEARPKPGGETELGEAATGTRGAEPGGQQPSPQGKPTPTVAPKPKRFHGTVSLDPVRVGLDASRIADEVIAHLTALPNAVVKVTLEIEAAVPGGTPDNVVRTVTQNSRTLKFTSQDFETE